MSQHSTTLQNLLPKLDLNQILTLANTQYGKTVDSDIRGTGISDFQVLVRGAYGPAVIRLIHRAQELPGTEQLSSEVFLATATQAFAEKEDFDFANNRITDYAILFNKEYGFGTHMEQLVTIARRGF